MGVTLGLLPTKGLTLPFLSYGGTSLLINMASIGILMNIGATEKDEL
jgi:cell division protein FtsW